MDPEEVWSQMQEIVNTPSNSNERLLQKAPRGYIIQEHIKGRDEFKFQVIWGQAIRGTWLHDHKYYFYDIDGTPQHPSNIELPSKQLWSEAAKLAEEVAEGTDALRVDILVKSPYTKQAQLLVNELELRQQLGWDGNEDLFSVLITKGYMDNCRRTSD